MKYEVEFNEDVAKVCNYSGKVLIEVGRTCPLCGSMCDIELRRKTLFRRCSKCDREWSYDAHAKTQRR